MPGKRANPKATKKSKAAQAKAPSPTASIGRDSSGRFAPGNTAGKGNPLAKRVGMLRSELIGAVSPAAMRRIALALIRRAEKGDIPAARLLLSYVLGNPIEVDLLARIEELEAAASSLNRGSRENISPTIEN